MISERASAKINLFLHVGTRRADGFHPLQSLAVFTDLGDALAVEPASELSLQIDGPFAKGLDGEGDNLVLRAARALGGEGAKLTLTKNLPVASGIGGGSADAAAALRGLNALWNSGKDGTALCDIAAALGSDIPVCVLSTPSFMEGRGEILRAPDSMPRLPMLLVNPRVAVPTKDVFAALQIRSGAEMTLPRGRFRDTADLLRFLETTRNDLEAPALQIQPVIGEVLTAIADARAAVPRLHGPLLVLHGTADKVCRVEGSRALADDARKAGVELTLKEYAHLFHEIFFEPQSTCLADAVEWMRARVDARPPAGA